MQFPPGLTLDQKFAYALALAQERRDAIRAKGGLQCRDKPVVSRTGRVVKPATIPCGKVCRQKENCKTSPSPGKATGTQPQRPATTRQEISEAVRTAVEKKRRKEIALESLPQKSRSGSGKARKASGQSGPVGIEQRSQDLQADLDSSLQKYLFTSSQHFRLEEQIEAAKSGGRKPDAALMREFKKLDKDLKERGSRLSDLRNQISSLGQGTAPDPGFEHMTTRELTTYAEKWEGDLRKAQRELALQRKQGKDTRDASQKIKFLVANIEKAKDLADAQKAGGPSPRQDSLAREVLDQFSQNYFGLNPNPFHHPLWDLMGY